MRVNCPVIHIDSGTLSFKKQNNMMNDIDLSILKYYKEGKELCGFEGVHDSLCNNGYLDDDLELTNKAREFIKSYPDWESVKAFNNQTYISI